MSSESVTSEENAANEQLVGLLRGAKMEARMEHETAKRYKTLYGFTTAIGSVLFVLTIVWCQHYRGGFAWTSNPALQFNWHPMLMVLGMVLMYSQSMLVYRTGRSGAKKNLKLVHAVLHFGAFICSVVGLKAVFDFHNNAAEPIPNLYTLHSWLGLICVIIFAFQFVAGFCTFLLPIAGREIRRISLPIHVIVGTLTFVLSIAVCLMGLTEKAIFAIKDYNEYSSEGLMVNFIGIILSIYGMLALYLVIDTAYKRLALPEEELALAGHTE